MNPCQISDPNDCNPIEWMSSFRDAMCLFFCDFDKIKVGACGNGPPWDDLWLPDCTPPVGALVIEQCDPCVLWAYDGVNWSDCSPSVATVERFSGVDSRRYNWLIPAPSGEIVVPGITVTVPASKLDGSTYVTATFDGRFSFIQGTSNVIMRIRRTSDGQLLSEGSKYGGNVTEGLNGNYIERAVDLPAGGAPETYYPTIQATGSGDITLIGQIALGVHIS